MVATTKDLGSPKAILCAVAIVPSDLFSFKDHRNWDTGTIFGMKIESHVRAYKLDSMPPFSPLYFLNGYSVGTLGFLLLGFSRGILPQQKYQAHLLLVQWHKPHEAHRIAKLTAQTEKEVYDKLSQQVGKLEWRDVKLV